MWLKHCINLNLDLFCTKCLEKNDQRKVIQVMTNTYDFDKKYMFLSHVVPRDGGNSELPQGQRCFPLSRTVYICKSSVIYHKLASK
jgi:hypothetical protein